MTTSEVTEIYTRYIQGLSRAQQLQLLEVISRALVEDEPSSARPPRNIMELHGLGKEIWHDVDAQDYVNRLRDEWEIVNEH